MTGVRPYPSAPVCSVTGSTALEQSLVDGVPLGTVDSCGEITLPVSQEPAQQVGCYYARLLNYVYRIQSTQNLTSATCIYTTVYYKNHYINA